VLVVDDEDHVRLVARRMLERHGYQVRDAASGSAALELIGDPAISIDILLTDLVMPGMDGRQLIARAAALRPGLPVICMTGFAGSEDDTLRLGGNLVTVMSKPFAADALLKAVGSAGASSAGS
jgi:two-component system cell cycle sensor histidine kinase/response regulator CckA